MIAFQITLSFYPDVLARQAIQDRDLSYLQDLDLLARLKSLRSFQATPIDPSGDYDVMVRQIAPHRIKLYVLAPDAFMPPSVSWDALLAQDPNEPKYRVGVAGVSRLDPLQLRQSMAATRQDPSVALLIKPIYLPFSHSA